MLEGVLRRVRTWREAEIKLRKGVWEQKVLEEAVVPRGGGVGGRRKRKRGVSVEEEKDVGLTQIWLSARSGDQYPDQRRKQNNRSAEGQFLSHSVLL